MANLVKSGKEASNKRMRSVQHRSKPIPAGKGAGGDRETVQGHGTARGGEGVYRTRLWWKEQRVVVGDGCKVSN